MPATDDDTFYNIKKQNLEDRQRLRLLTFVMGSNFFVLLCMAFNWCWWKENVAISFILSFVYLLYVLGLKTELNKSLFYVFDKREKCWRDYYESPDFVYHYPPPPEPKDKSRIVVWVNQIDCAPIYNDDIVVLSDGDCLNDRYLRANYKPDDILELTDLKNTNVYYSVRGSEYEYRLKRLKEKLQEDNLTIVAVYNKYGDVRWRKADKKTSPSKWRKFLYEVKSWSAMLAYLAIVIMPVVVILNVPDYIFQQ